MDGCLLACRRHPLPRCTPFADTLRLLLVLGSQCNLPDKEGCTPLHWAAIRGHTEACTVLLQVRRRMQLGLHCGFTSGGRGAACLCRLVPAISAVHLVHPSLLRVTPLRTPAPRLRRAAARRR